MACGLVYGHGEDLLFDWFKQAWLQEPAELKVMNEGLNHIPTVHVIDVARLVRKIITTRPARQYILAVDKTIFSPNGGRENSKALNIVKSISTNVGSGRLAMVQAKPLLASNPRLQYLLIDLFFKPSELMYVDTEGEEEQDQAAEDDENKKDKLFDWYSEFGIDANIEKIRQDFNKCRGLSNIKMLISGPLATGKSIMSEKLAEF